MKSWRKIALGMFLVIGLVLTPWGHFSDSALQIESEKERTRVTEEAKYITLTEENFQSEVLESTKPVLVDFWAEWCGRCHAMAPVIEELAVDFEGHVIVGKLNIDDNMSLAMEYGIRSIPTLLFFKDGQIVDQVIGIAPKKVIADNITQLLEEPSATIAVVGETDNPHSGAR